MKKIIIDKNKCIGCGECWYTSDSVFDFGGDGKACLRESVTYDRFDIDEAEKAMINCPTSAISIKDKENCVENDNISFFQIINSILDWANSDDDDN